LMTYRRIDEALGCQGWKKHGVSNRLQPVTSHHKLVYMAFCNILRNYHRLGLKTESSGKQMVPAELWNAPSLPFSCHPPLWTICSQCHQIHMTL